MFKDPMVFRCPRDRDIPLHKSSHGDGPRLRPRFGQPTLTEIARACDIGRVVHDPLPIAMIVYGPPETGKSVIIRAGTHINGYTVAIYECMDGSNANTNLQSIGELITRQQTVPDARGRVLVVQHPERSTCPEALVRQIKRMAAAANLTLICEVSNDVRSDDTANAFCGRTRGILTLAPLPVGVMTYDDARCVTCQQWDRHFPARHMPEYLPDTLRSITGGRIGRFPEAWRFAEGLFRGALFVPPGMLWEFLRPSDEDGDTTLDDPYSPLPSYPDRRVILEVEAYLDSLSDLI